MADQPRNPRNQQLSNTGAASSSSRSSVERFLPEVAQVLASLPAEHRASVNRFWGALRGHIQDLERELEQVQQQSSRQAPESRPTTSDPAKPILVLGLSLWYFDSCPNPGLKV